MEEKKRKELLRAGARPANWKSCSEVSTGDPAKSIDFISGHRGLFLFHTNFHGQRRIKMAETPGRGSGGGDRRDRLVTKEAEGREILLPGPAWGWSPAVPRCPTRAQPFPTSPWGPALGICVPSPPGAREWGRSPESRQVSRGALGASLSLSLPHAAGDSGREKYPLTSRLCSPGLTRWIISRNPSFPWLLLQLSFCSFSSPFFSFLSLYFFL